MKKAIFTLTVIMMSGLLAFAQNSGKGFNYQAIARDINGQVLQNEMIILQFGLYAGEFVTEPAYQELQLATTDEFGAFSLTVGHGQSNGGTLGSYEELDYGTADFWLKVELKDGDEFHEISFRELMSVPYAEVARNAMPNPVGTILPFAGPDNAIPDGYLLCDGALSDKNEYQALYAVIGNAWGGNSTHFRLPDCRGMFLRGVAHGAANDPDRNSRVVTNAGGNTGDNIGSAQLSQNKSHDHNCDPEGEHSHTGTLQHYHNGQWTNLSKGGGEEHSWSTKIDSGEDDVKPLRVLTEEEDDHFHNIDPSGGNETRPINVYVNYIIKY